MVRNVSPVVPKAVVLTVGMYAALGLSAPAQRRAPASTFTSSNIGTLLHKGSTRYDASSGTVRLAASGENVWGTSDDFRFAWKKLDGEDLRIGTHVAFESSGGNPHRKALVMIRQNLDPGSPYVDVAVHGNGLTSLQYRDTAGGLTHEIEISQQAPERVSLERRGDSIYLLYDTGDGQGLHFSGATIRVVFQGPVYAGLGLSAHDKDGMVAASFSNVEFSRSSPSAGATLYSTLEVVPIASTDRRVVMTGTAPLAAPNWLRDNSGFVLSQNGRLLRVPANLDATQYPAPTGKPNVIDTGAETHCGNEHGISPDGRLIAFTDSSEGNLAHIYTVPLAGGKPLRVTASGPSYWHGWSPDGTTLLYTGQRGRESNIYTVPAKGGTEMRLTNADWQDEGPEYSPDGKWIYFNSDQTGHMQIWRMHLDGGAQQQVTHEENNDWFPHLSPDGKWMVYLAYPAGVPGSALGQEITLVLMSLSDGKTTVLAKLRGGQGTMDVPSWSPDSTRVAFVSYAMY